MTDISVLSKELKSRVEWQETPRLIENAEYADYVLHGIQQLFALTSRPGLYSESRL